MTDGLKGIPEALGKEFRAMTLQTCIMNLIRNSLSYASWKERKPIYAALNADAATAASDEFKQGSWGKKFLTVVASWSRAWDRATPFFAILVGGDG